MFKEIFICVLILSMIFVGNYITQSYKIKYLLKDEDRNKR